MMTPRPNTAEEKKALSAITEQLYLRLWAQFGDSIIPEQDSWALPGFRFNSWRRGTWG